MKEGGEITADGDEIGVIDVEWIESKMGRLHHATIRNSTKTRP